MWLMAVLRPLPAVLDPNAKPGNGAGAGTTRVGRARGGPPLWQPCPHAARAPTREGLGPPAPRGQLWPHTPGQPYPRHSPCHWGSCLRLPRLPCPLPILAVGTGMREERCQGALRAKSPSLSPQKEAWPEAAGDLPNCPGPPRRSSTRWGRGAPATPGSFPHSPAGPAAPSGAQEHPQAPSDRPPSATAKTPAVASMTASSKPGWDAEGRCSGGAAATSLPPGPSPAPQRQLRAPPQSGAPTQQEAGKGPSSSSCQGPFRINLR